MAKRLTYKNATFKICTTPQNGIDLTATTFAALTYVLVTATGKVSTGGTTDSVINYDTTSDAVTQKQKGIADGGSFEIEYAFDKTGAGPIAMRAAAETDDYYATLTELSDGTKFYNRGLILSNGMTGGSVNDFVVESFMVEAIQKRVMV